MKDSTSDLLRDNCDEFIYYEDLGQRADHCRRHARRQLPGDEAEGVRPAARVAAGPAAREQGGPLVVDGQGHDEAEEAVVQRERTTATAPSASCWRTRPTTGLVEIERHKRSGTYVVTRFGSEPRTPAPPPAARRPASRAGPGGRGPPGGGRPLAAPRPAAPPTAPRTGPPAAGPARPVGGPPPPPRSAVPSAAEPTRADLIAGPARRRSPPERRAPRYRSSRDRSTSVPRSNRHGSA